MQNKQLSPAEIEAKKIYPTYHGDKMGPSIDAMNTGLRLKQDAFVAGAEWQKEQDKELFEAAKNLLDCYNRNDGYVTVSYAENLKKAITKYLNS